MRFLLLLTLLTTSICFADVEPIKVVTTTGMIGDLTTKIGGSAVGVTSLMGPGVDPHLYKATHGDISRLSEANLILFNGLHLEGKMSEILESFQQTKKAVAVTRGISKDKLRTPPEFEGQPDPHIWFDVSLWSETIPVVRDALVDLVPSKKDEIFKNAQAYSDSLARLHEWTKTQILSIAPEQRLLITAHDAFGYFGSAYGMEVMGLQGISTASEFGLQDVKRVTDAVVSRKVKAIFVEASVPERFILSIQEGVRARGTDVEIGGELYSDSMGESGSRDGNYIGMVEHNVLTIVKALGGTISEPFKP